MEKFIPIAQPIFKGKEREYVNKAIDSTFISSKGEYIGKFEEAFADFCKVNYAISCCNGTVALHLALLALGLGQDDEVILPTLTYVATANAVKYCQAKPVFVDSEIFTWNIDPYRLEEKITKKTKGIIVVHLYGHPVDIDPILAIAQKYGLFVLEDAAQAHGAEYKSKRVGALADIATFSFYGNKIITCGEGGMVVTNNQNLADKVRQLKGQGVDPNKAYWFPIVGYNYRMTNIQAAIGLGQLENITWHIEEHIKIKTWYKDFLSNNLALTFQGERVWANPVYWMVNVLLEENIGINRDGLINDLLLRGIETRPIFYPMHILPIYKNSCYNQKFPYADKISQQGLSLPTWAGLTKDDVKYIADTLKSILELISKS